MVLIKINSYSSLTKKKSWFSYSLNQHIEYTLAQQLTQHLGLSIFDPNFLECKIEYS